MEKISKMARKIPLHHICYDCVHNRNDNTCINEKNLINKICLTMCRNCAVCLRINPYKYLEVKKMTREPKGLNPNQHPQVQIFRSTSIAKDFQNANVGDWIQSVGEITTEYEKNFIRRFGSAKESSDKVLYELQLWRMKRMNGTLKKDVWQAWDEETDYINELRSQHKGGGER